MKLYRLVSPHPLLSILWLKFIMQASLLSANPCLITKFYLNSVGRDDMLIIGLLITEVLPDTKSHSSWQWSTFSSLYL